MTAQTPNSSRWGDSYVIDPWGNLLQKNVTKGTAETLSVTVNSNNQISTGGYRYDASGNMLSDTINSLLFNAENQMTPQSGLTYTYDGDGRRVVKSTHNLDLIPSFGTKLSMILDERKGKGACRRAGTRKRR